MISTALPPVPATLPAALTAALPARLTAAGAPPASTGSDVARAALMLVLLGLVGLAAWGMRRGWRTAAARQRHLPAPPARPALTGAALLGPLEAIYASTTPAGQWLSRLVVHDLGARSPATVTVTHDGVLLDRVGAASFMVPTTALRGVGVRGGIAGATPGRHAVVVLTWQLGDPADPQALLVDTGVQPRRAVDRDRLVAALRTLLDSATGGPRPAADTPPTGGRQPTAGAPRTAGAQ